MKKKVLMSSIVTIVLCLTLIAGSTYALFTSESNVNVAVTSGKVVVKAVASDFIYESEFGSVLPESINNNNFRYDDDSNIITIGRMVPGDQCTKQIAQKYNISVDDASWFVTSGKLENHAYDFQDQEIKILFKDKHSSDIRRGRRYYA